MLGIHDFWLFAASGVVLTITPGPDTLYILGRSIAQGRRAGVLSVLGISTGIMVHTTAAALGLSALLASSAAAFSVVRWIGAAYLVYLGLRMLLRPTTGDQPAAGTTPPMSPMGVYRQGLFTNLLNPKVALFFLAFLPQFVDPHSPHRIAAFLLLGLEFILIGTTWSLCLAWFAAAASRRLREQRASGRWLGRASGVLFIGLGARVARG
ncbi:MAG: Lysine exporter protein [Phycisphaerales bacterium]|jgi:RhtB (resistance to homoserine/threonine) family protein|nr:Lysine exporter protein [Phycisphaerales bacterium]